MEEPKPETTDNDATPPLPQAETVASAESTPSVPAADSTPQMEAQEPALPQDSAPGVVSPATSEPAAEQANQPSETNSKKPKLAIKKPNIKVKDPLHVILIALLVIVAFMALSLYFQANNLNKTKKDLGQKVTDLQSKVDGLEAPVKYDEEQVKTGQIQAVFLNSGQVYFGNLIHLDSDTMTLQNIYYLKEGTFQKNGTVSGSLALVKLGNELHGPEDQMVIERKNVTFWENLKADSQVSKAIVQYKASH